VSAPVDCVSCVRGIQRDFLGRVTASIQKTARATAACGNHSSEWPENRARAAHRFAAPTATKRILWRLRNQLKDARCSHADELSRELAVFGMGLFRSRAVARPGTGAEKECQVLRRGNSGEGFSLMDAAVVSLKGSRKNMAREESERGGVGQARCAIGFAVAALASVIAHSPCMYTMHTVRTLRTLVK
jgi:hypothetical protein